MNKFLFRYAEKPIVGIQKKRPFINSRLYPWLPHLLVVFWLFYLGISIWQHALQSVQPPIYDSLGYIQKAMNFWSAVENGKFFNPLDLEPVVRPPGTILMSYPFGFSPDFRGFHFRSVFFPILCVVASVYIVAGSTKTRASSWWVAAIAFLISSLPMFYQLDMIESIAGPTRWGLVDNFQAGIAAMAAAAIVKSVAARSQLWLLFGSFLAAFTLLIKPSGAMVMALIGLTWLIFIEFEWLRQSRLTVANSILRVYAFTGSVLILIVYAFVGVVCFFSRYLSSSNFDFAKRALEVMRELQNIDFQKTLLLFHKSSGEGIVLWIIGAGVLYLHVLLTSRSRREPHLTSVAGQLVGSLLTWSLGAWYWLGIQAGGTEIRYFYPFMLMGTVYVIPMALYGWLHANRPIRLFLMTICIIPALNIAGLMVSGEAPSIVWQKISGVSISVGRDREEVSQAYDFLNALREMKTRATIYSFSDGIGSYVFEHVGLYEGMVMPNLLSFGVIRPLDWSRGFAVRIEELLDSSDYILVRKYGNQHAIVFSASENFNSFNSEQKAFQVWLGTLDERCGVTIASEGRTLRLLQIIDRRALNQAIELFVAAHTWRPEFVEANQPRWWNAGSVSTHIRNLAAEGVDFGGIYKLHALSINRLENGIKVDVWWEELRHVELNRQRYLFLHVVDLSGNIVYNQQIALYPYDPPFENRRWRHGAVTFYIKLPNENLTSLGFGVYQTDGAFLLPDRGRTDWEGRRILIPINALTSRQTGPSASVLRCESHNDNIFLYPERYYPQFTSNSVGKPETDNRRATCVLAMRGLKNTSKLLIEQAGKDQN